VCPHGRCVGRLDGGGGGLFFHLFVAAMAKSAGAIWVHKHRIPLAF
jgi:hypothetical protein